MSESMYDFIVVGGGILGASTAMQLLQQQPSAKLLLLEKESHCAAHQTGRNSGVIHAGVYYKPGSLKAKFCKEGNIATKAFCQEEGIPFDECGKLLVATDEQELSRMSALVERCSQNELPIDVLDEQELALREPMIRGLGAIFVPSTGIVSYAQVTHKMLAKVKQLGGEVRFSSEVVAIEEQAGAVTVCCPNANYQAQRLIVCSGVMADRLVNMVGIEPDFKIIPFRGEYFLLPPKYNSIVNHLIYPIPDPDLPFLGVHLTKMIDGTVTVGPNAVLAFKRTGYRKSDFSLSDTAEMLGYSGLRKLVFKHFRSSLVELKNSISKAGYLKTVQKYCPSLEIEDLRSYPPGIRAQAVSPNGDMIDDFLFVKSERCLFVCNAPSPAATSAIPIGAHIIEQLQLS